MNAIDQLLSQPITDNPHYPRARRAQDRRCRGLSVPMGFVLPWKSLSCSRCPGRPPGSAAVPSRPAGGGCAGQGACRWRGGRWGPAAQPSPGGTRTMPAALSMAGGAGRRHRRGGRRRGEGDGTRYLLVVPCQDALHRLGTAAAAPLHGLQHRAQLWARLRARLHARLSRSVPFRPVPPGAAGSGRAPPARRTPRPLTRPTLPRKPLGLAGSVRAPLAGGVGGAHPRALLLAALPLAGRGGERTPSPSMPNGTAGGGGRRALLPRGTMGAAVRAHSAAGSRREERWECSRTVGGTGTARHLPPPRACCVLSATCPVLTEAVMRRTAATTRAGRFFLSF